MLHVLLIDDDPMEFRVLKDSFRLMGADDIELHFAISMDEALDCLRGDPIDLVIMDNQLLPNNDFRETAPVLRKGGFTGPIGVISNDIAGAYFQDFADYGVDFRMGKDEIDPPALRFVIGEFTRDNAPAGGEEEVADPRLTVLKGGTDGL